MNRRAQVCLETLIGTMRGEAIDQQVLDGAERERLARLYQQLRAMKIEGCDAAGDAADPDRSRRRVARRAPLALLVGPWEARRPVQLPV